MVIKAKELTTARTLCHYKTDHCAVYKSTTKKFKNNNKSNNSSNLLSRSVYIKMYRK